MFDIIFIEKKHISLSEKFNKYIAYAVVILVPLSCLYIFGMVIRRYHNTLTTWVIKMIWLLRKNDRLSVVQEFEALFTTIIPRRNLDSFSWQIEIHTSCPRNFQNHSPEYCYYIDRPGISNIVTFKSTNISYWVVFYVKCAEAFLCIIIPLVSDQSLICMQYHQISCCISGWLQTL